MAEFVSKVSAADMKGPVIRSSGNLGNDHNSTFVTSLMTALISDAKYQSKLDEYWKEAVALGDENYFNQSLKLLNGLLVSGNMPNLMNPPSAPTSSSSVVGSSSSAVGPESSAVGPESSSSTIALPAERVAAPAVSVRGRTLQLNYAGFARVDLFSVTGSEVKSLWNGHAEGAVGIGMQGIPAGVYVVRIRTANSTSMQKIRLQ